MERYACIHGHFYQPPRENPWLETIEQQDSAYPFHDWNERITRECYAPNASARILDADGRIHRIRNNYARISFNFGPTLLSWLETHDPATYQGILQADVLGAERYGKGSAMAQAYNHMIMPLANDRDKRTQVRWGIRDFEHRFRRRPEGMWLPETAVDESTLDALAAEGIRFTVLAPNQCLRVRDLATGGPDRPGAEAPWQEVGGGVDPSMPYLVRLPSGRSIVVFFYDGPVSHDVAFQGLLTDGRRFLERFLQAFPDQQRPQPALAHIATDGETYGHHQRHGEMALAYALRAMRKESRAILTNYASFLDLHPPWREAQVRPASSWSCAHGIERWRHDCGCSGGRAGWHQRWRAPLRQALDWLRDGLAGPFETECGRLLQDPWAARDDYIEVVLDRSDASVGAFFARHATRELTPDERVRALKLLEMQRHLMLMYTSCGWFFDEVTGIETVQVLMYAGRVVQLADEALGAKLEPGFVERLAKAPSNLREQGDAARAYRRYVKPAMVDLPWVASHYAVASMFEETGPHAQVHAYDIERLEERRSLLGRTRAALGVARVRSRITHETADVTYLVLHLGEQSLHGGVRRHQGKEAFQALAQRVWPAFDAGDVPELVRIIDAEFSGRTYSLRSLFRDEQRRIVATILDATMAELEAVYRQAYDRHAPLLRFLADIGAPQPKALAATAEFVVNAGFRKAIAAVPVDAQQVQAFSDAARRDGVELDRAGLAYAMQGTLERLADGMAAAPMDLERLARLERALQVASDLPFDVDLWLVQNRFYGILRHEAPAQRAKVQEGDAEASAWLQALTRLGELLNIAMEPAA